MSDDKTDSRDREGIMIVIDLTDPLELVCFILIITVCVIGLTKILRWL